MAMPQNRTATASQVEQRDPQPVLSVRASVPVADLAAAQSEALRALWSHLQQHGGRPAGPGWEVYHWIDLNQEPEPAAWPDPSTWRTQLVQPIR